MNAEALKRLYGSNPKARVLLEHALRKKDAADSREPVTVDALHKTLALEGMSLGRRELIRTLRILAQAGCGRFLTGRRGQVSRFHWDVPSSALGTALQIQGTAPAKPAPEPSRANPATVSHVLRLRANLQISLTLPPDLTSREAERIARFVQTLPIEG